MCLAEADAVAECEAVAVGRGRRVIEALAVECGFADECGWVWGLAVECGWGFAFAEGWFTGAAADELAGCEG